jgi:predicted transcriptional regulator
MTSEVMMGKRTRLGISVADETVELLDQLVASGHADSRSAAIDALADAWRRWQTDADLIEAARTLDPHDETSAAGVVGADPDPPQWPSVARS